MDSALRDAVEEDLLERLAAGQSLTEICDGQGMPTRRTVQRWQDADAAFDVAVTRAREAGFHARAEQALIDAKAAKDASLGRLAFDAERWYLGKLSNAFSDNKPQRHEHKVLTEDVAEWLGQAS